MINTETPSTSPIQARSDHAEGPIARRIETETAKLPSDTWLWAAIGAMGASLACQISGRKSLGLFLGQWVSPFLLFGVYNKIVKVEGSDAGGH